jgi:glycosyltransferase involved in cell wall biosynthesis
MHAKPVASVIIPTYNRSEMLARTLISLRRQRPSGVTDGFEVIVADDGSEEDLASVIAEADPSGRTAHVRHERAGFRLAETRNMGAEAALGGVLIFLDCGTLAGPDLVSEHVRLHRDEQSPQRAVLGPTFGYSVEPQDIELVRKAFLSRRTDFDPMQYSHIPGLVDYRTDKLDAVGNDFGRVAVPWRYFWGRNISLPSDLFGRLGGFSEQFRSYGVEDVEFGYRVRRSGVPYCWAPRAWALEIPGVDDRSAHAEENRANLRKMHTMHGDREIEFFYVNRPTVRDEQAEWDRLRAWTEDLDPVPRNLLSRTLTRRPVRLSIGDIGDVGADTVLLDPTVPPCPFPWTEDGVPLALSVSGFGLRTGYADRAFQSVHVGARMAGVWARWGAFILAEANRIGVDVTIAPQLAEIPIDQDVLPVV